MIHFLVPWPDAAWTRSGGAKGREGGTLPDENSAKKAIAFDRPDPFFKRLFLLPGPDAARTWSGGARGRTKSTLPDEKAAKRGIAFDGINAIYFNVFGAVLVHGPEDVQTRTGGARSRGDGTLCQTKILSKGVSDRPPHPPPQHLFQYTGSIAWKMRSFAVETVFACGR